MTTAVLNQGHGRKCYTVPLRHGTARHGTLESCMSPVSSFTTIAIFDKRFENLVTISWTSAFMGATYTILNVDAFYQRNATNLYIKSGSL